MSTYLSPFVYWGQTDQTITLMIDLKNVQSPSIELKERSLNFYSVGKGAKGLNEYAFFINLYSEVIPEESFYKITDRSLEMVLKKKSPLSWPRLLESVPKPQWLKVDFDRIKQSDMDTTSSSDTEDEPVIHHQSSRVTHKDRNISRSRKNRVQELKTAYLFLYNLFLFVGFLYLFVIFTIHLAKEGPGTIKVIYPSLRNLIKFLNMVQIMEIVHPLIGYTSGSALIPAVQLFGRTFFIFLLVDCQEEIQSQHSTFFLLLVYTISELFRYPYYMLHIYKVNLRLVTWIRYSAWIILYPIGFICEGIIIHQSIPLLEQSGQLSISMPNPMNIAFYMPIFLRIYLHCGVFILVFYFITSHMYEQRKKVLNVLKKKVH